MHEHVTCKFKCIMGSAQSKPTSTQHSNKVNTHLKCMKHCYNAHVMQCMKFQTSFWQNPSQKFSKNFIDFETLRCTNIAASSRERWTRVNSVSSHNLHEHNFASHLHNLWRPLKESLYMFRVVRKKSSNIYPRIGWKSELKICFS